MIPRVVAIALVSALLLALLEGLGFRSKRLFATLCVIILMIGALSSLSELMGSLSEVAEKSGITEAASCAIRAVGLGYVFGFTSEVCSSLGEASLASLVTLVGRVEIFLVAYPYFEKTLNLGLELLK